MGDTHPLFSSRVSGSALFSALPVLTAPPVWNLQAQGLEVLADDFVSEMSSGFGVWGGCDQPAGTHVGDVWEGISSTNATPQYTRCPTENTVLFHGYWAQLDCPVASLRL